MCPQKARLYLSPLKNYLLMTGFMYVWGSPFTLMFLYIKIWAQVSAIKECESAVIIHTSPPSLASFPSPRPIPSGHHRAPDWALCAAQQLLTSQQCVYVDATFSSRPALSPLPLGPQVIFIRVSIPSLQTGSSISFLWQQPTQHCKNLEKYLNVKNRGKKKLGRLLSQFVILNQITQHWNRNLLGNVKLAVQLMGPRNREVKVKGSQFLDSYPSSSVTL